MVKSTVYIKFTIKRSSLFLMFSSHLVAFRSLKKGRLVSSGYYLNYSCPLSIQYIYRIHLQNSVESAFGRSSSWGERVLLCSSTCSSCCVCSPRHKTICFNQPDEPGRARMEKPTLTSPLQELASPNQMFDSNVFYLPNMYCKMCALLPKKTSTKKQTKKDIIGRSRYKWISDICIYSSST